jgi:hypothetical protein
MRLLLPVFSVLLLAGCEDISNTSSSSSSGGSVADAGGDGAKVTASARACLDTADTFAKAQARCGADYEASRKAVIRDLANGDCDTVSIRNETELRTQCFPSLATISCADLKNQRFAPSCAGQIVSN